MATESTPRRKTYRERSFSTGFPVRCTDAEKREIFARAARAKRSASRFLVELALREDVQFEPFQVSPEERTLLEGLVVQLRRVGTNLHEIGIRQSDSDEHLQFHADAQIRSVVREVSQAVDQLRSLLV